ncbi:MAG: ribonuclease P protein component [bacterium]
MLPRQHRLIKEGDFNRAFRRGRSNFAKLIGVKVVKNNLVYSRFGFIVSNKVAKKANKRNLIKRRLRAIVHRELGKIKPGYDLVIIALGPITGSDYQAIGNEVMNCFKKLNVL